MSFSTEIVNRKSRIDPMPVASVRSLTSQRNNIVVTIVMARNMSSCHVCG